MRSSAVLLVVSVWGVSACSDDAASEPPLQVFPDDPFPGVGPSTPPAEGSAHFALNGELVKAPTRPMVTGTLAVTTDGKYAAAADSERDRIVVVDLKARTLVRVALNPGAEPGRTVAGATLDRVPRVYSVLRRDAALAEVELPSGKLRVVPTCLDPRGVAFDEPRRRVHVACSTGELVTYDAESWKELRRLVVARDLRDVLLTSDGLLLSRYSSAELIHLDEDGDVLGVTEPAVHPTCTEPTVMHRVVSHEGQLYLAHQLASTEMVLGRSGDSRCAVAQSTSVVTQAPLTAALGSGTNGADFWKSVSSSVVHFDDAGSGAAELGSGVTALFVDGAGPMDLAVSADGRVAVTLAGNFWTGSEPQVVTWQTTEAAPEPMKVVGERVPGVITSIAFDANGEWLGFSREPAALYFENGATLYFGGESRNDTAFSLFHMNSGAGVSCASCHPEGGEDGHVWLFPRGLRRTLPLGLASGSGKYNWDASFSGMDELLANVLNQQMSHEHVVLTEQATHLAEWVRGFDAPGPGVIVDVGAVSRGRRVFFEVLRCDSCHMGETLRGTRTLDIDTGGFFVAPSLLGVGARSDLLHDGCAATLRDVFGACGGPVHALYDRTDAEIDDLVAFLATL